MIRAQELARYLRDVALDPGFRALARRDPEASFAGYELTAEDREVLARQDETMLELLTLAVRSTTGEERSEQPPPSPDSAAPASAPLPEVKLWLRVLPVPGTAPTPQHQVQLVASEPTDGARFEVSLQPARVSGPDGSQGVHYTATIRPVGAVLGQAPAADPWGHRSQSPEARSAAEQVLSAPPEARREALERLVAALVP